MPSLNLRNALKRDPSRPTLKQRAATLKATAGRVLRRRPTADALPPATGADPRLAAMTTQIQEARRRLNDPAVPDGPEADALGETETRLLLEILRFPSQSAHDLAAKLPFLREEADDAGRGWDTRRGVPFEASVPGAAWAGLLRDIEHLAAVTPKAEASSAPIAEGASSVEVTAHPDPAERYLSEEAFDYANGLDLSRASDAALYRLYEVFLSAYTLLSPVEYESVFTDGKQGNFPVLSDAGLVMEAELNRLGCLRDAAAMEMERRKPKDRADNRMRLEVVIGHRMKCEAEVDAALLVEFADAWGA